MLDDERLPIFLPLELRSGMRPPLGARYGLGETCIKLISALNEQSLPLISTLVDAYIPLWNDEDLEHRHEVRSSGKSISSSSTNRLNIISCIGYLSIRAVDILATSCE